MKHRGEVVEQAVRTSGIPLTELARRLKKSRRHIYNLFENPNVSLDDILQIGKIIHHDFSDDFPEIYTSVKADSSENLLFDNKSPEYWKDKYLQLLEKYNKLLEKYLRTDN
jgi:predicted transcriptional regulator